jgi:hypothetical protein
MALSATELGLAAVVTAALALSSACYQGVGHGLMPGADADSGADGPGRDDGNGDDDTGSDADDPAGSDSPGRLWRLTARQYERTIEAGLQVDVELPSIAITARTEDFTNKASDNLVDDVFFSQIEGDVEALVTANVGAVTAQLPCTVSALDDACLRTFLETFTLRVQRTDSADIEGYLALFDALRGDGTAEQALIGVVTAVLISPKTLFRTELGAPTTAGQSVPLTPFELADTLAYSVWDGPPDDELLARAVDGSLSERVVFEGEVDRLLATEAGHRGMIEFLSQWLGLAGFEHLDKNTTTFPEYDGLRDSMRAETEAFLEHVLGGDEARLSELIGASQTIVDAELADFYGIELPPGETSALVDLPAQRRGVFTHPAVIAAMSEPTLTGVMYRGKVLLRRLLCTEIVPPPDVEFPEFDEFPPEATTRDRLESLEVTQPCAGCHIHINPLAFAMETYDAIGRYRDTENGSPIDASGSVHVGGEMVSFADAPDLFAKLAEHEEVHECFAEHAFRYTWGRELQGDEDELLSAATQAFADHADVRELFRETVIALAFRDRRGEDDDECVAP